MGERKKKAARTKKRPKMKGHYCKVCDSYKSNESFSGRGHNAHICKSCASKSPAEKAEDMTINKLYGMGGRRISKDELNWLKNRMKDKRPEVRELAKAVHNEKFPNYERNMIKKSLRISNLELRVNGEVYDSYGDEYEVNVVFICDSTGKITRKSYDTNGMELEEAIREIGQREIRALFNSAVHNYNIFFWDEDLCREISYDPDIDILPEYREYDDDGLFEWDEDEDEDEIAEESECKEADREPVWSVFVKYTNKIEQDTKGFDSVPNEVMELYIDLSEWFEDELDFEDDDYE